MFLYKSLMLYLIVLKINQNVDKENVKIEICKLMFSLNLLLNFRYFFYLLVH